MSEFSLTKEEIDILCNAMVASRLYTAAYVEKLEPKITQDVVKVLTFLVKGIATRQILTGLVSYLYLQRGKEAALAKKLIKFDSAFQK